MSKVEGDKKPFQPSEEEMKKAKKMMSDQEEDESFGREELIRSIERGDEINYKFPYGSKYNDLRAVDEEDAIMSIKQELDDEIQGVRVPGEFYIDYRGEDAVCSTWGIRFEGEEIPPKQEDMNICCALGKLNVALDYWKKIEKREKEREEKGEVTIRPWIYENNIEIISTLIYKLEELEKKNNEAEKLRKKLKDGEEKG